jgi:Mg2+/Co2+ transporter CorC
LLLTPTLSSFGEERENYFVAYFSFGRGEGVGGARLQIFFLVPQNGERIEVRGLEFLIATSILPP